MAIAEGKRIAALFEENLDALETAASAEVMESSEPERKATEEERGLLTQAIGKSEELTRLLAKQSCLEWQLRASMGSSKGIDGILSTRSAIKPPAFDEKALLDDEPEIHEQFVVEQSSLKRSFCLAEEARSAAELEPDLVNRQRECKGISVLQPEGLDKPTAERSEEVAELHEQYLKNLGEISLATIDKRLVEARIKAACGSASGIDDVCKWSRDVIIERKFDHRSFAQAHPELFERYLIPPTAPELRVIVNPMRAYMTEATTGSKPEEQGAEEALQRQPAKRTPMTESDRNDLIKQAQSGVEDARNELLRENLQLIVDEALKYSGLGRDHSSLMRVGEIALDKAIEHWEGPDEKNKNFIGHAKRWIKAGIHHQTTQTWGNTNPFGTPGAFSLRSMFA